MSLKEILFILKILSIVCVDASQCCNYGSQSLTQKTWKHLMSSLDTNTKQQLIQEIVDDLKEKSPQSALVITGQVATDPGLQNAIPKSSYVETLRQLNILIELLGNEDSLEKHIRHYVLYNHIHQGQEAESVTTGLREIFSNFLKISDLDQSIWGTCLTELTQRIQKTATEESEHVYAECIIDPTTGDASQAIHGRITLEQPVSGGSTVIRGDLLGFDPNDNNVHHGFHVHMNGALGNKCKDAGGHYNPEMMSHGGPRDKIRHVGDLGNIEENEDGNAHVHKWDRKVSLAGEHSIINRAIVVHAMIDDLSRGGHADSKTTGHAGARLGCCLITQVNDLQ